MELGFLLGFYRVHGVKRGKGSANYSRRSDFFAQTVLIQLGSKLTNQDLLKMYHSVFQYVLAKYSRVTGYLLKYVSATEVM